MSYHVNFSTHGKEINSAYQAVISESDDTNWLIYAFDKGTYDLRVQATGDGGLEELNDEFSDGKVQFAYAKVIDPNTELPKFVFIGWCGSGVPELRKAFFNSQLSEVSKFFKSFHVQINARDEADVEPELIMKRVSESSGANYSVHKETARPQPRVEPSNSVYKKTEIPNIAAMQRESMTKENAPKPVGTNYVPVHTAPKKLEQRWNVSQSDSGASAVRAERERFEREVRERETQKNREIQSTARAVPDTSALEAERKRKEVEEQSRYQEELRRKEEEERRQYEEQQRRAQAEEEERYRQQEESRLRQQEEEDRYRQQQEANRRQQEEESRRRQQEEEDSRRQQEEQERQRKAEEEKRRQQEEAERKRQQEEEKIEQERRRQEEASLQAQLNQTAERAVQSSNVAANAAVSNSSAQQGLSAVVLFEYDASESNEMSLVEGEVIVQIDEVDEGWWFGISEDGKKQGLFPANYVQLIEEPIAPAAPAIPSPPAPPAPAPPAPAAQQDLGNVAIALYDYQADEDNEISFNEGDTITQIEFVSEDWWQGTIGKSVGLFPANYVELKQ